MLMQVAGFGKAREKKKFAQNYKGLEWALKKPMPQLAIHVDDHVLVSTIEKEGLLRYMKIDLLTE